MNSGWARALLLLVMRHFLIHWFFSRALFHSIRCDCNARRVTNERKCALCIDASEIINSPAGIWMFVGGQLLFWSRLGWTVRFTYICIMPVCETRNIFGTSPLKRILWYRDFFCYSVINMATFLSYNHCSLVVPLAARFRLLTSLGNIFWRIYAIPTMCRISVLLFNRLHRGICGSRS